MLEHLEIVSPPNHISIKHPSNVNIDSITDDSSTINSSRLIQTRSSEIRKIIDFLITTTRLQTL